MRTAGREIFASDLLSDKRILITGGGTGLGRGVAARLVKHGAEVHLWGRREAVLAEAAAEAADRGRRRGPRPAGVERRTTRPSTCGIRRQSTPRSNRSGSGTGR